MDTEQRQTLHGGFAAVVVVAVDLGRVLCYGRPIFVVLLLTSRLCGVSNGQESYEEPEAESSCQPGEYYDGVVDKCVACTEICQPQQHLDFCRNNCPEYYREHFGPETASSSTPATRDVISRSIISNKSASPHASTSSTSSRLPDAHIRRKTTPAGSTEAGPFLNPQILALVQTDQHWTSTVSSDVVSTTVSGGAPARGDPLYMVALLCSVLVLLVLLLGTVCCLICLLCRSRRPESGRNQLAAAFRGLVDVERSSEYSWKKNVGGGSGCSHQSSLSGSASKCGGAVDGFEETRLLPSCSSYDGDQQHQSTKHQSAESHQSLLTPSLLLQEDDRSGVRTCNNELVQLTSGTMQSSSAATPSVSVVCTLSLLQGNVNDGSGKIGDSSGNKVVLVTCSLCPSNNEALAVAGPVAAAAAAAVDRGGEGSQVL